MVIDHTPIETEVFKIASLDRNVIQSFLHQVQDCLMRLNVTRASQRHISIKYKDEILCHVVDEYEAEIGLAQNQYSSGGINWQKARVRILFLAFLSDKAPVCDLGLNDASRQGKEIVSRHDIIPVKTDEWIATEDIEFHQVVEGGTFAEESNCLRFTPLDSIQFELCRFRVRPPPNFELPLLVRAKAYTHQKQISIRLEVMVAAYWTGSRRAAQAPCQNIQISFPIPKDWIYLFKYERFGYRSVKSVTRSPGKIRGIDRITQLAQGITNHLGAQFGDNENQAQIEVNTGQAKYENITQALTWRIDRLPERNQGAYKTHLCNVNLTLGEHDKIPEQLEKWVEVFCEMPASYVSHTAVRSISVRNKDPELELPDKWVSYASHFRYKVEIEYVEGPPDRISSDYGYGTDVTDLREKEQRLETQEEYPPDSSDSSNKDSSDNSDDEKNYSASVSWKLENKEKAQSPSRPPPPTRPSQPPPRK